MTIPWIQVYSNLIVHPKTYALASALGIKSSQVQPTAIVAGMLIGLWTWAMVNAEDGDVSGVPDSALAEAMRWKGDEAKLKAALEDTGWLAGGRIHDWEDYAMRYVQEKKRNADRQARHRERAQAGTPTGTDYDSLGG